MYNINDYVIYKRDVCKIVDIKKNNFTNLDSYVLSPIYDDSLKVNVPIIDEELLRKILNKKQVEDLINKIPNIDIINTNDKNLENEYKVLLHTNNHEDLIKIIKTTYLRNKKREENKRNIGQKDKEYFEKAEKYLYNELSIVLGLSFEETKQYVIERVSKEK